MNGRFLPLEKYIVTYIWDVCWISNLLFAFIICIYASCILKIWISLEKMMRWMKFFASECKWIHEKIYSRFIFFYSGLSVRWKEDWEKSLTNEVKVCDLWHWYRCWSTDINKPNRCACLYVCGQKCHRDKISN